MIGVAAVALTGSTKANLPSNSIARTIATDHQASQPVGGFTSSRFDSQAFIWSNESGSTTASDWTSFPPPSFIAIKNRGPVTAIVSFVISGGPIEIRMRLGGSILRPAAITSDMSDVTAASVPVSFGFSSDRRVSGNCHRYWPEWRSVTGEPAEMESYNVAVYYRSAKIDKFCE